VLVHVKCIRRELLTCSIIFLDNLRRFVFRIFVTAREAREKLRNNNQSSRSLFLWLK
jgi:hypothetical protein